MQPSSAQPEQGKGGQLRRWGPLAIVVVLVIIVGVVVIAGRGDNDKKTNASATTTTGGTGQAEAPKGAISFSQAKAQGLKDATFQKGCDTSTGRVAMPYYFAPECYVNVKDNGGATATGVTADTITVVVYLSQENDPVINFITAAIKNDDTNEQIQETYQGYTDMFQAYFQTYGRKVQLKFMTGSGISTDSVAARADAVKAADEGAFAVWGGPALTDAWSQELQARGVVCLGCTTLADNAPSVFPIVASAEQTRIQLAEYIAKKLGNKPAKFAGAPALQSQTRKFGELYIDTGGDEQKNAADLKKRLADKGVDLPVQIGYALDPSRIQETAVNAISQLKSQGVTSVIFLGDPVAPGSFTTEATKQDYHPEWIFGGAALADTTAFGRTYDQSQWAHAFGISSLAARIDPDAGPSTNLYKWFKGTDAPAFDTSGVLFPQPALFFAALQAAGPDLTLDNFRQGLFSLKPFTGAVTQPSIGYGNQGVWDGTDYNGIDDFTEIWWDPKATGPDEIRKQGTGMLRFVDGGKRYLPGQWTSDLKVFDEKGSVTIYEQIPEKENPKDYPSPADSSTSPTTG
jgi:hypothetical protein